MRLMSHIGHLGHLGHLGHAKLLCSYSFKMKHAVLHFCTNESTELADFENMNENTKWQDVTCYKVCQLEDISRSWVE